MRLQAEIGRALGDVIEDLKGFGSFGLFQKPKHVGQHKRVRWAPKHRPKFQLNIQSSKIGAKSFSVLADAGGCSPSNSLKGR